MVMESPRWAEGATSEFVHERHGLHYLRTGLPNHDPYRAWSNVEFIDSNGRLNEVDAIVVMPRGLFLIELKHWTKVLGDAHTWTADGRTKDNPYRLANSKAKRLRSLLERNWPAKTAVPFVESMVFLSNPALDCRLHAPGRPHVFGRTDAAPTDTKFPALPDVLEALKNPDQFQLRGFGINTPTSNAVAAAFEKIGVRSSNRARRLGDYVLHEVIDEGDGWQDLRATRPKQQAEWRARIYLTHRATTPEETTRLTDLAEREARVLDGVKHPGVIRPLGAPLTHEFGPALLFERERDEQRLDLWVVEHLAVTSMIERLELVRSLAEAMRYAHGRGLTHGRLNPRAVSMHRGEHGWELGVGLWHTASRSFGDHATRLAVEDTAAVPIDPVYLAPEVDTAADVNEIAVDVFGVGALAHLLLTGQPIAVSLAARATLFVKRTGADPRAVDAAVPSQVGEWLSMCTEPVAGDRPDLPDLIAAIDDALAATTISRADVDPLEARPGDVLDKGALVRARLGAGSTAVALLVSWNGSDEVLKVALDEDRGVLLRNEHDTLKAIDHERIIRCHGLVEISGRTVLRLVPASHVTDSNRVVTLADRLRIDGRPALDLLARWGTDLIDAAVYLENNGIAHRDIKPDNLGVRPQGKNEVLHLALFDFSLAKLPAEQVLAGTPHYADPFLAERTPVRWDTAAERYSVAVTLHEMATGRRPVWGDGTTDPCYTSDTSPHLDPALFDDVVRDRLLAFFDRAFQRRPDDRHHTAAEMLDAWRSIFADPTTTTSLDATPPSDEDIEAAIVTMVSTTPAVNLPLSGLARASLERLAINTAGDLAEFSGAAITNAAGIGNKIRAELRDLSRRLRVHFAADTARPIGGTGVLKALLPESDPDRETARAILGLHDRNTGPWPPRSEAMAILGIGQAEFLARRDKLRQRWAERSKDLTLIRRRMVTMLDEVGGVAGADEIAERVIAQLGYAASAEERRKAARAIVLAALEADRSLRNGEFTYRHVGRSMLIAHAGELEDDDPVEWASRLGVEADDLAERWPLAPPGEVLARLRAITPPTGTPPFPDGRLVALAASGSRRACVSSRLELYPRGMNAARAVEGARPALLGRGRLREEQVHSRVAGRFLEAEELPTGLALHDLMNSIGLVWEGIGNDGAFVVPLPEHASATAGLTRVSIGVATLDRDEAAIQLMAELAAVREAGGYRVLTTRAGALLDAEAALVAEGFTLVSLEQLMVEAMHHLCESRPQPIDWTTTVLAADIGGPDLTTNRNWRNLARLAGDATVRVAGELRGLDKPVVLSRLGLVARYGHLATLLDGLRESVRLPADGQALRSLIVIVPADDPTRAPLVGTEPIPLDLGRPHRPMPAGMTQRHSPS